MDEQLFTRKDVENAKNKNIIEMAWAFSAMRRVFAEQSDTKILHRLEAFFMEVSGVTTQSDYDALHSDFCDWFVKNISTAEKTFQNGRSVPGHETSFGEAAKVLDVVAKVYIYYCVQPSPEVAQRLVPLLHAALDTKMMRNLCHKSPSSLRGVDRTEYQRLRDLVAKTIADSGIYPVQYDDVTWRRLQRSV